MWLASFPDFFIRLRHYCMPGYRNIFRRVILNLSEDWTCIDLLENFSGYSLKRDLSTDATFNPHLLSLVNTFKKQRWLSKRILKIGILYVSFTQFISPLSNNSVCTRRKINSTLINFQIGQLENVQPTHTAVQSTGNNLFSCAYPFNWPVYSYTRKTAVVEFFNNLRGLGTEQEEGCRAARQASQPGGIGSLESILELLKRLKILTLQLSRIRPEQTQLAVTNRYFLARLSANPAMSV